jgi:hypothetical protein
MKQFYFVLCLLIAPFTSSAFAQTNQLDMSSLKIDPTKLDEPVIITINFGARSELFHLSDKGTYTPILAMSTPLTKKVTLTIPFLNQINVPLKDANAQSNAPSILATSEEGTIDDTIVLSDKVQPTLHMISSADKAEHGFTAEGLATLVEAEKAAIIASPIGEYVEIFSPMLKASGYAIDLKEAIVNDSRQGTEDLNKTMGSLVPSIYTDGTWRLTSKAFTITVQVTPKSLTKVSTVVQ